MRTIIYQTDKDNENTQKKQTIKSQAQLLIFQLS